jgi:hypothetical protein
VLALLGLLTIATLLVVIVSRTVMIDRTRPLCAYPAAARHKGTGSIDEAANFSCAAR